MENFVFGSLSTVEKRLQHFQAWRQGVKHHSLMEPRKPQSGDSPTLTVLVGMSQAIKTVECTVSEPDTAVYSFTLKKTSWDLLNWQYMQVWQVKLPPQPNGTIVRYKIKATPAHGQDPIWADEGEVFSYFVRAPEPPEWTKNAIIYQIFPDRFYAGNGRSWPELNDLNKIYGGTIRGIIEKLDYIADIGFNCIWINPFLPDHTHHRYHATDYYSVEPTLGTLDDVRELVSRAHEKGIRLLFDFVANHWGIDHTLKVDGKTIRTFAEAQADQNSPYHGWYKWIDWPHDWWSFFGVKELPEVNVEHPDVRRYLLDSAKFWLCDVGFDGLRLDYALGPTHDFWTDLYAMVKTSKPDAWVFGEVVETPTTIRQYEGRMDGCLDFPLMQALKDTFALERMSLTAFDAFLNNHDHFFQTDFSRPSFLDNHDMNRFLFAAKNNKKRLKLGLLCLFTLQNPPTVYYGTEIGLSQNTEMSDPNGSGMAEARQPMCWDEANQDLAIKAYLENLITLRKNYPVFVFGERQTVHCDESTQTFAYLRSTDEEKAIVAFNLNDALQTIEFELFEQKIQIELEAESGEVKFL
ncbi:MAG: alpha-amylase family glycosyl hydrolase [Chloroflexota bacterium]